MSDEKTQLNILFVGEDEAIYAEAHRLLNLSTEHSYVIKWSRSYKDGLVQAKSRPHDVYIFDYDLSIRDGLELANEIDVLHGSTPPAILLIREFHSELYLNAIKSGLSDCLCKNELTLHLLERAIHSAIARKQCQSAVFESELTQRAILSNIANAIVTFDDNIVIESFNIAAEAIFGHQSIDIIGESLCRLIPELENLQKCLNLQRQCKTDSSHLGPAPLEYTGLRKNGDRFFLELLVTVVEVNNRNVYSAVLHDISLRKKMDNELRLLASTFDLHSALLITDANGLILRINHALKEITGYQQSEIAGKDMSILLSKSRNEEALDTIWYTVATQGQWEGEIWGVRKSGEQYPQFLTITAIKSGSDTMTRCIANFHDITERKLIQSRIEHQAHYDMLTDLPNRRFLLDRLEQEIARASREDVHGGLLFFDLDNFKKLNDSQGHAAGDLLLQQMAKRLQENVRAEDIVARLGGDEFVVLLPYLNTSHAQSSDYAHSIAEKLQNALAQPFDIEGRMHNISASIGISMFPIQGESANDILRHADSAMYSSKATDQDSIIIYQSEARTPADYATL
ncbi:MAG: diguanylate cyclase domain-containing protein [Thiohalomonadales bacterium]